MGRAAVTLSLGLLLLVASAHDSRADDKVDLDVVSTAAARSCTDGEVLRSKIAERLGRDPFVTNSDAHELGRLHVAFAREQGTWTAKITLTDGSGKRSGERTLTRSAATCGPLVTEVAFTIAVLLENLAPAEPVLPAAPAPLPEPVASELETAAPKTTPQRTSRIDAAIGGAGTVGGAPAPTVGGEVALGVDVARLRIEVGGRLFFPASSDGDVAVRTRAVYGRLAPCYGLLLASACFVVAVGSVSGEAVGAGVASSRIDAQLYAAGGVGALSRFFVIKDVVFVRASVDLLFSLSRVGFDVGDQRVWTVPMISGAGTLGLGARLP